MKQKPDDLIPINIVSTRLVGLSFEFTESVLPNFVANVALIDDTGKQVTTITVGSSTWRDYGNIELSGSTYALISEVVLKVTVSIVQYMNSQKKILDTEVGN